MCALELRESGRTGGVIVPLCVDREGTRGNEGFFDR